MLPADLRALRPGGPLARPLRGRARDRADARPEARRDARRQRRRPRARAPARGASSPSGCPPPSEPGAPGRRPAAERRRGGRAALAILVVDDNVDTARGLARLLKLLGHEVRMAHDGPDGHRGRPRPSGPSSSSSTSACPAWTATRSPGSSGASECCKDAVIIAVSGYGQDEDRRRSSEAGFDHHLVKPSTTTPCSRSSTRPNLSALPASPKR